LRLLLNAHSEIAIPEEARFLMPLLRRDIVKKPLHGRQLEKTLEYLENNEQYRNWNYDRTPVIERLSRKTEITLRELIETLYSSFAESEGKSAWADKSLFFRRIGLLSALFPEAKFIHLVRDGRDVFHSWRKMDPTKNNVAAAALDWNYKLSRIERAFARLPESKRLTIRYEDLLETPEETTRAICDFIGIDFESEMMNYHHTSKYYIGGHHSSLIFKSIDPNNRYKWRKNLSSLEIRIYELICQQNLTKYGYDLSGMKFRLSDSIFLLGTLLTGVPKRAYQVLSRKISAGCALRHGEADNSADAGETPVARKQREHQHDQ